MRHLFVPWLLGASPEVQGLSRVVAATAPVHPSSKELLRPASDKPSREQHPPELLEAQASRLCQRGLSQRALPPNLAMALVSVETAPGHGGPLRFNQHPWVWDGSGGGP